MRTNCIKICVKINLISLTILSVMMRCKARWGNRGAEKTLRLGCMELDDYMLNLNYHQLITFQRTTSDSGRHRAWLQEQCESALNRPRKVSAVIPEATVADQEKMFCALPLLRRSEQKRQHLRGSILWRVHCVLEPHVLDDTGFGRVSARRSRVDRVTANWIYISTKQMLMLIW